MKRRMIFLAIALLGLAASGLLAQPRTHVVRKGETLWGIAVRHYENGYYWPVIFRANQGVKNPDQIFVGQVLLIPEVKRDELGLTLPKLAEQVRELEETLKVQRLQRARQQTDQAARTARLEKRVEEIERLTRTLTSPPLSTTPTHPFLVWLDGAWCATRHPNGYGAREVGGGFRIGRLTVYSGTSQLSLAVARLRLPGVKVAGFELSPLLISGFKTINLNLGRDLSRHSELISNARPFGAVGLSLDFQSSGVSGQLNWYGWANDIKGPELWDPYQFQRLEGALGLGIYKAFSLMAAGVSQTGYLPEWQILGMVSVGAGYRVAIGYGHQNPFAERHSRGMVTFRVEKSLSF